MRETGTEQTLIFIWKSLVSFPSYFKYPWFY